VALSGPRVFAEKIDQLWISSWEEMTKTEALGPPPSPSAPDSALSAAIEPTAPFAALVASYEQGARVQDAASGAIDLVFRVTSDVASQTRAVVLQALDYLRTASCTRLGIVFPEANALALGVAEGLGQFGVPLDDGMGSLEPGLFEKRCWLSWVALQEEPGVPRLIAWLRACQAQGVSSGAENSLSVRAMADIVEDALSKSLVDDLDFLARYLEQNPGSRDAVKVAGFLRGRVALPGEATFARYLALTRKALKLAGWEEHLARLQIDPPAWLHENEGLLSRGTFLEWLRESTASQTRTRGRDGNHFYGKAHLLIYAQATGQVWSHLILTGLNEGVWPRVSEVGAFGSLHDWAELNREARTLNRRGEAQGGQGMGHETVGAERGHCLLPLERQELALRDLSAALEATSASACLTAMTTDAGRSLMPSDFFGHAYQVVTGHLLDEETFGNLAKTTEAWCRPHEFLFASEPLDPPLPIAETQIAYAARRDPTWPFGPYEFSHASPPPLPIQLSCKTWETAWNHPATVWLEEIVGAARWPEGTLSWSRTIGTWAHRWLAAALRECRERDSPAVLPVLLWAAADREASAARNLARAANMELYPWWEQVWGHARALALGLAETITPYLQDRLFLSEFSLPADVAITLDENGPRDFVLKGRIDLLLVEAAMPAHDPDAGDFSGSSCWVIDFKTGVAQSLNARKIAEGVGLQPLLYAMAVQACGAVSTAFSLHTPHTSLHRQVQLDALTGLAPLFRSLKKFHCDGVFGMRADTDNAYGYSPSYPIATRFVPKTILTAKWALTHESAEGDEE
jgi:hypothetical protein